VAAREFTDEACCNRLKAASHFDPGWQETDAGIRPGGHGLAALR
jgi:hypothetical protein